jgi:6-pyruvoyltetrahydropterin/6-carboxytetrahydropterin synthase
MVLLTRRYRFSASHRLHSPSLSKAENSELYGKCNNPYGHGHDYMLELTVAGEPDPVTGLVVPLSRLDQFVNDKILRLFAHRNINLDVPQFFQLAATTENVVLVIGGLVEEYWFGYFDDLTAYPSRVYLQETDRNGFEAKLGTARNRRTPVIENESVMVNV